MPTPPAAPAPAAEPRITLGSLSFSTRLGIAAFLVSVGVGYVSALVQLHFQHASPGNLLPTSEDAVEIFHGKSKISQMERILLADEGKSFNGSGTMRPAFTTRSAGWGSAISKRAKKEKIDPQKAENLLRAERAGERLAMLAWIRGGLDKQAFEDDAFPLPPALEKHPITEEYVVEMDGAKRVKIASMIEKRCARCHSEAVGGSASQYPLESYEQFREYCDIQLHGHAMSLPKLAQTTHVHLLGFAMLYGLTGIAMSLSSYPGWMRAVLTPLPLIAQVVDISFWWLARLDPAFAQAIAVTGGIVGLGLMLQIVLCLFDLFKTWGRLVLVVMMLVAGFGAYTAKNLWIDPHLTAERVQANIAR